MTIMVPMTLGPAPGQRNALGGDQHEGQPQRVQLCPVRQQRDHVDGGERDPEASVLDPLLAPLRQRGHPRRQVAAGTRSPAPPALSRPDRTARPGARGSAARRRCPVSPAEGGLSWSSPRGRGRTDARRAARGNARPPSRLLARRATVTAALVAGLGTVAGCAAQAGASPSIQVSTAYVPVPHDGITVAYVVIRNNGTPTGWWPCTPASAAG